MLGLKTVRAFCHANSLESNMRGQLGGSLRPTRFDLALQVQSHLFAEHEVLNDQSITRPQIDPDDLRSSRSRSNRVRNTLDRESSFGSNVRSERPGHCREVKVWIAIARVDKSQIAINRHWRNFEARCMVVCAATSRWVDPGIRSGHVPPFKCSGGEKQERSGTFGVVTTLNRPHFLNSC